MRRSELGEAGLHALDYWRVLRNRWPLVVGCLVLVYLTAMAVTYMTPQKFLGRTLVEISRPAQVDDPVGGIPSHRFIENQFKIISSKEVLGRVVQDLGLVERWGTVTPLAAYRELNAALETDVENGTDMVAIEVMLPEPDEAAEVANAVTDAYEARRRDLFKARQADIEQTLAAQEASQAEKVAVAHAKFITVAEKLGIANIDPSVFAHFGEADDTGGLQGLLEKMQAEVFQRADGPAPGGEPGERGGEPEGRPPDPHGADDGCGRRGDVSALRGLQKHAAGADRAEAGRARRRASEVAGAGGEDHSDPGVLARVGGGAEGGLGAEFGHRAAIARATGTGLRSA